MAKFVEKLFSISKENKSLICVGLDPDPLLIPLNDVFDFTKSIVDSTNDLVAAYKPNLSFYEAMGIEGLRILFRTINYIRNKAPNVVIIGDGKRGDIGSTNLMYAKSLFDVLDFDAATVNPYGGCESLNPFFEYTEKGVFIWCHSSNPGSTELQDQMIVSHEERRTLYEQVALNALSFNEAHNIGLVMGSTFPDQLGKIRGLCKDMPLLVPGVGKQGGILEESVEKGLGATIPNLLINSSRGILYASLDKADFDLAARDATISIRNKANNVLRKTGRTWSNI